MGTSIVTLRGLSGILRHQHHAFPALNLPSSECPAFLLGNTSIHPDNPWDHCSSPTWRRAEREEEAVAEHTLWVQNDSHPLNSCSPIHISLPASAITPLRVSKLLVTPTPPQSPKGLLRLLRSDTLRPQDAHYAPPRVPYPQAPGQVFRASSHGARALLLEWSLDGTGRSPLACGKRSSERRPLGCWESSHSGFSQHAALACVESVLETRGSASSLNCAGAPTGGGDPRRGSRRVW